MISYRVNCSSEKLPHYSWKDMLLLPFLKLEQISIDLCCLGFGDRCLKISANKITIRNKYRKRKNDFRIWTKALLDQRFIQVTEFALDLDWESETVGSSLYSEPLRWVSLSTEKLARWGVSHADRFILTCSIRPQAHLSVCDRAEWQMKSSGRKQIDSPPSESDTHC